MQKELLVTTKAACFKLIEERCDLLGFTQC